MPVDRSQKILEAAIRDFISSGDPVSSEELYERHDFGVKPASIRAELLRLTKKGLLVQPHTSAGRVPTERGYQFFVDAIMAHERMLECMAAYGAAHDFIDDLYARDIRSCVSGIAEELGLLSVGCEEDAVVHKSGFQNLCAKIDYDGRGDFLEIVRDFERLDERIHEFVKKMRVLEEPRVFIGSKSPITDSKRLSVIIDAYDVGDHGVMIVAVGPTRMNYEKPVHLMSAMRKELKNKIHGRKSKRS